MRQMVIGSTPTRSAKVAWLIPSCLETWARTCHWARDMPVVSAKRSKRLFTKRSISWIRLPMVGGWVLISPFYIVSMLMMVDTYCKLRKLTVSLE